MTSPHNCGKTLRGPATSSLRSKPRLDALATELGAIPNPRALLATLCAFSPAGFQIYDSKGVGLLASDAFRELFERHLPPRPTTPDPLQRAFAGESVTTAPSWCSPAAASAERKRVAVSATFFPLRDASEKVVYVASIFRDATLELEAQEHAEARRHEAEDAARRQRFLVNASAILASSLELEETAASLARLLVPEHAAFGTLMLIEGGDRLVRIGESRLGIAAETVATLTSRPFPRVIEAELIGLARRGEVRVFHDYAAWASSLLPPDDPYLPAVTALGLGDTILAPLTARGRAIGALSLSTLKGQPGYTPEYVTLARELGQHAGLALENARLFAEVARARVASERANRAKDEFLAMLGHELRNPLAPIVTALELLRLRGEKAFPVERTIISRQIDHMVRLVDDLLDTSRITRGTLELRRTRLELATVLAKAIEMVSPLIEVHRHRLTIQVAPEGLAVIGDENRLAQVFSNLLSNAARYGDDGSAISIAARREDHEIVVTVKDNGHGIEPELLPRIFDSFVQGQRSLDRVEGGLGLGLTIVRSLVEAHGGSVHAASEGKDRGTELTVRLPVAPELEPESVGVTAGAASTSAPPATTQGRRVLVVDDNRDAAIMLADLLALSGYDVRIAHDGPAAIERGAAFEPEVVLLDIGLPIMDGYEVARRLRAMSWGRKAQIIALTGYGQARDGERAREAGCDQHLVKPIEIDRLLGILARVR